MIDDDDIDGLAAEYALGSLDLDERNRVDNRRRADARLDAAIAAWERRLAPLMLRVPSVEPPSGLFAAILTRVSGAGSGSIRAVGRAAPRRGGRWAAWTAGVTALAACLALAAAIFLRDFAGAPTSFVAELHRAAGGATSDEILGNSSTTPAFVVAIDLKERGVNVRPVLARPAPRRSYELWLIPPGGDAPPLSLGIISHSAPTQVAWPAGYPSGDLTSGTMIVSLEPENGPPRTAPTGPIVFAGRLVAATP